MKAPLAIKWAGLGLWVLATAVLAYRLFDSSITTDYLQQGIKTHKEKCVDLIKLANLTWSGKSPNSLKATVSTVIDITEKNNSFYIGTIEIHVSNGKLQIPVTNCD